jgi:recombination protein RecT
VALAAAYVRRDQYLMRAMVDDTASLILALRECAALGHVPRKGEFALTAFWNNRVSGYSVVGIEEWRGVVQRMFRSGGVRAVHVGVGRENDEVLSFQQGTDVLPRHKYDEFASKDERGPLKAVWAWADLIHGGPSEVAFLNRHDIARLRSMSKTATYVKKGEAEATGGNFWGPAWPAEGPNTEAMWRKTALHQLEGVVPTSSGYRWEAAAAGAAAAATSAPGGYVPDVDPAVRTDWVDAEVVPDGGQA